MISRYGNKVISRYPSIKTAIVKIFKIHLQKRTLTDIRKFHKSADKDTGCSRPIFSYLFFCNVT